MGGSGFALLYLSGNGERHALWLTFSYKECAARGLVTCHVVTLPYKGAWDEKDGFIVLYASGDSSDHDTAFLRYEWRACLGARNSRDLFTSFAIKVFVHHKYTTA